MNSMDRKPRSLHLSSSALRLIAIGLLVVSPVVGQRVYPSGQANSNNGRRSHNTTIRSADSADGSRVSITSDQSLADYEAYRRGERFYVKVPASEVPRAESLRGRGFNDVTAQRSGDGTTLSFRLQPGASAHVEQRGNKLDVVISAAGGGSTAAANRPRDSRSSDRSASGGSRGANNRGAAPERGNPSPGNKNSSSARDNTSASATNSNSKSKSGNTNSTAATNKNVNANGASGANATNSNATSGSARNANSPAGSLTNNAGSMASPANGLASPTNYSSPTTSAQSSVTPATSGSPLAAGQSTERSDFWSRAKERGHYWLQFAQLNPLPVAIGAGILVLFLALLLMQRRRARATRRAKTVTKSKSRPGDTAAANSVEYATPAAANAVLAATPVQTAEEPTETTRVAAVPPIAGENGRRERTSPAAEEASKVFAGETYDESVVGSDNPETRRLVGAELLSAMVGRNSERRDRARAAFMKHGYFDDATRDLRTSSSDNERAAAARRLSFVQDPEATPHLVGALSDSSPDVRRAAVEALMDQRDPAAIAPLNALLQNETDRKVPRHLIEQAIEACATNSTGPSIPTPAVPSAPSPAIEADREVIEI